jgi:hypothetical protein
MSAAQKMDLSMQRNSHGNGGHYEDLDACKENNNTEDVYKQKILRLKGKSRNKRGSVDF